MYVTSCYNNERLKITVAITFIILLLILLPMNILSWVFLACFGCYLWFLKFWPYVCYNIQYHVTFTNAHYIYNYYTYVEVGIGTVGWDPTSSRADGGGSAWGRTFPASFSWGGAPAGSCSASGGRRGNLRSRLPRPPHDSGWGERIEGFTLLNKSLCYINHLKRIIHLCSLPLTRPHEITVLQFAHAQYHTIYTLYVL